jgi:hypothetical protein
MKIVISNVGTKVNRQTILTIWSILFIYINLGRYCLQRFISLGSVVGFLHLVDDSQKKKKTVYPEHARGN